MGPIGFVFVLADARAIKEMAFGDGGGGGGGSKKLTPFTTDFNGVFPEKLFFGGGFNFWWF